eukprot:TRINITY_DN17691_c0_g2_i1.p1 TRINITY_DN17691_c0_g2~~TRINITY_DN17691_c0_g2_i1.p1  ORF type:complete len:742 (+),score=140.75 TRINITY_DN17691_c0_g2_i1:64-2289(+)
MASVGTAQNDLQQDNLDFESVVSRHLSQLHVALAADIQSILTQREAILRRRNDVLEAAIKLRPSREVGEEDVPGTEAPPLAQEPTDNCIQATALARSYSAQDLPAQVAMSMARNIEEFSGQPDTTMLPGCTTMLPLPEPPNALPPQITSQQQVQQQQQQQQQQRHPPNYEMFKLLVTWQENRSTKSFGDWTLERLAASADEPGSVEVWGGKKRSLRISIHDSRRYTKRFSMSSAACFLPTSQFSVIWNLISMVVLTYELIMLPMQVFDLPDSIGMWIISLLTVSFWTCDVAINFLVAYYTPHGDLVTDRWLIAKRYISSWFVPDFAIICADWVLIIQISLEFSSSQHRTSLASILRVGKVLRYLRFLRFLRLRKVVQSVEILEELLNSQYFTILKTLMMNCVCILLVSHFLGCIWFWVGTLEVEGYDTWVKHEKLDGHSWVFQYLLCLHWSLTQLTPGSMHVQPQNALERMYAVVVLVLGMIAFSSIVSSITSAMNSLKSIGAQYHRQRWLLKRFLREQRISRTLTGQIMNYADKVLKPQETKVAEHQVELLKSFPSSLYMDLVLELHDQDLEVHPFFRAVHKQSKPVFRDICNTALKKVILLANDVMFFPGQLAHSMYFVVKGKLNYRMLGEVERKVCPQEWFCEAALWTNWVHQGVMKAAENTEMIELNSERFQEAVKRSYSDMSLARKYATEYVYRMNERAGFFTKDTDDDVLLSDILIIDSAIELVDDLEASASILK